MSIISTAEPSPDLRDLLPDDPRLNLLEILEFRNAAHLESIAESLTFLSENVPGALDESAAALNRIADAAERFNKLFASVIGRGLVDDPRDSGALASGMYIRTGDGDATFRQAEK